MSLFEKTRLFCGSFRCRVTMTFVAGMVLLVVLGYAFILQSVSRAQFEQLREKLMIIARTAALTVDRDKLLAIPLERSGADTPAYISASRILERISDENSLISDIYILKPTVQPGIWEFIVDPDPEEQRKEGVTSYPGDKYHAARFPAMMQALQGASADEKLSLDEWGATLSGYAPIADEEGNTMAVLGVDMKAADVYESQRSVQRKVIILFVFGLFLSVPLGMLLARGISRPVKALVEGTRRISQGDLQHKVSIAGSDEFGELAESFNKMADDLAASQEKRREYFYDVIRSLVRIVEAKDPYTRGHSERVADYTSRIAASMGFSDEGLERLHEAALLHDIGKMGVEDAVLHKKTRLTDEEWDSVRRHTIVGEEILRPIALNSEMLAMVRNHHERYDGKGYPDGLNGAEVEIFTQILSVADSYDAMTSSRSYRKAMPREEAMAELLKNKGTQFHPGVVDHFVKILEQEAARSV